MAASGARLPIHNSHCAIPCATNISTPETVRILRAAASAEVSSATGDRPYPHKLAIQFARFQRRTSRMRMHPDWRGIDDRVKFFFPQRRAFDHPPPTARANSFAAFSRRAHTNTSAPAFAIANAAARAAPPAPKIRMRLALISAFLQGAQHAQHNPYCCPPMFRQRAPSRY